MIINILLKGSLRGRASEYNAKFPQFNFIDTNFDEKHRVSKKDLSLIKDKLSSRVVYPIRGRDKVGTKYFSSFIWTRKGIVDMLYTQLVNSLKEIPKNLDIVIDTESEIGFHYIISELSSEFGKEFWKFFKGEDGNSSTKESWTTFFMETPVIVDGKTINKASDSKFPKYTVNGFHGGVFLSDAVNSKLGDNRKARWAKMTAHSPVDYVEDGVVSVMQASFKEVDIPDNIIFDITKQKINEQKDNDRKVNVYNIVWSFLLDQKFREKEKEIVSLRDVGRKYTNHKLIYIKQRFGYKGDLYREKADFIHRPYVFKYARLNKIDLSLVKELKKHYDKKYGVREVKPLDLNKIK